MNDYTYLCVEDDAMSRDVIHMIMTRVMHLDQVYVFEDSQHIMARIQTLPTRPDVILLDIHMKPYDGFEVLDMLRNHPEFADTLVIAFTASVMSEEVDQLKTSGFDGVIGKPISITTFPSLIQRIIRGEAVWHVTDH